MRHLTVAQNFVLTAAYLPKKPSIYPSEQINYQFLEAKTGKEGLEIFQ